MCPWAFVCRRWPGLLRCEDWNNDDPGDNCGGCEELQGMGTTALEFALVPFGVVLFCHRVIWFWFQSARRRSLLL